MLVAPLWGNRSFQGFQSGYFGTDFWTLNVGLICQTLGMAGFPGDPPTKTGRDLLIRSAVGVHVLLHSHPPPSHSVESPGSIWVVSPFHFDLFGQ
jgi:hypothetical protein